MICYIWLTPRGGLLFPEGNLRSGSGEEGMLGGGGQLGEVNGRETAVGINIREE